MKTHNWLCLMFVAFLALRFLAGCSVSVDSQPPPETAGVTTGGGSDGSGGAGGAGGGGGSGPVVCECPDGWNARGGHCTNGITGQAWDCCGDKAPCCIVAGQVEYCG